MPQEMFRSRPGASSQDHTAINSSSSGARRFARESGCWESRKRSNRGKKTGAEAAGGSGQADIRVQPAGGKAQIQAIKVSAIM
jgi:hypothetical protein